MGDQKHLLHTSVDALSPLQEQRPFRIIRLESVYLFISSYLSIDSEQGPTKPRLEKSEALGAQVLFTHICMDGY